MFYKETFEALSMKKTCVTKEKNLEAWEVCNCGLQELHCSQQRCVTLPQPVWPTVDF